MDLARLAADVAIAYVQNNAIGPDELCSLIINVAKSLASASSCVAPPLTHVAANKPSPAEIKRSIGPDRIVSFEDGRSYSALKRHLTNRGMSPEEYRVKWGLPRDYPMVSENYSRYRSQLAREIYLGRR